jgi:predicted AAA+ superfamily ATPase
MQLKHGFGSYQGYIAENFVAQQLLTYSISTRFCWFGRISEIEFLLEQENYIIPVEVKSGSVTRSKYLQVYEEKYNPDQSIILSAKNEGKNDKGLYLPIYLRLNTLSFISHKIKNLSQT